MNTKAMLPLAMAGVLGTAAAVMVSHMVRRPKTALPVGPGNLVTVVVAKQDADPGHALDETDLSTARVPAETVAGGVFADPGALVGRVTLVPLVRGQTMLETLLAPTGSASGLAALVPPGMRAVTMEITEHSGVGGMLEPGCHVDVLCIVQDTKAKQSACRTVIQNVAVTAVGRNILPSKPQPAGAPPAPPANSITLLVTPRQAQTLELAQTTGRPWLELRSTRDGAEVPLAGTTMAELTGQPADAPADAVADATPPAHLVPAAMPTPTTKPAVTDDDEMADATPVAAPPAPVLVPATIRRTITVINGGVESQVMVTVPNPKAAVLADTDRDPIGPDLK